MGSAKGTYPGPARIRTRQRRIRIQPADVAVPPPTYKSIELVPPARLLNLSLYQGICPQPPKHLRQSSTHILEQLAKVCHQVQPDRFSHPVETLGSPTVWHHIGHTLEFFLCVEPGVERGV